MKPVGPSSVKGFVGHRGLGAAVAHGRRLDRVGKVETFALNALTVGDATEKGLNFAGIPSLTAMYYEAGKGEPLYRNVGSGKGGKGLGFAICTRCGYSDSERLPADRKGTLRRYREVFENTLHRIHLAGI